MILFSKFPTLLFVLELRNTDFIYNWLRLAAWSEFQASDVDKLRGNLHVKKAVDFFRQAECWLELENLLNMQVKLHSLKSILAPTCGGSLKFISYHKLNVDVPDLGSPQIKFHSLWQRSQLLKSEAKEARMTANQKVVFHFAGGIDFKHTL